MNKTPAVASAVKLRADAPARHRKAIMFCCDANYLPFATHAAERICELAEKRDFDICICHGQKAVSLPESLEHLKIRLCHIDVGNSFEGLRLDKGKTHDVYLRLALPSTFVDDYDRILYLDSDIFVQGGDFSSLLNADIKPHCTAAVRDHLQWRTPNKQNKRNMMKGVSAAPYFNAGVQLMDVKACISQNLMERCVTFGKIHRKELKRHDQNLFNAVLQGEWAELSPMWNWQFSWTARLFATLVTPNIVHFIGPAKPWKDSMGQFEPRFAASYSRFAKKHFPEFHMKPLTLPRLSPDSKRVTKMLIKHFMSRRKMARYLSRFPTDLTVYK